MELIAWEGSTFSFFVHLKLKKCSLFWNRSVVGSWWSPTPEKVMQGCTPVWGPTWWGSVTVTLQSWLSSVKRPCFYCFFPTNVVGWITLGGSSKHETKQGWQNTAVLLKMHFAASGGDQVLKAAIYHCGAVVAQHFPSKHIVSVWLEVYSDVHNQRCYCRTMLSLRMAKCN